MNSENASRDLATKALGTAREELLAAHAAATRAGEAMLGAVMAAHAAGFPRDLVTVLLTGEITSSPEQSFIEALIARVYGTPVR